MSDQQMVKAIRGVYDGALDDAAWDVAIDALRRDLLQCEIGFDHRTSMGVIDPLFVSYGLDPVIVEEVWERFPTPDEHMGLAHLEAARLDAPFLLESFVDRETFDTHPGMRTFFHRQRLDKGLFVAVDRQRDALSFLALFRKTSDPNFDDDDVALLTELAPHLRLALKLRDLRLAKARTDAGATATLHAATAGVAFLDPKLRVVDVDPLAERVLSSGGPLQLKRGRLVSASPHAGEDTETLHAFLRAAAGPERRLLLRWGARGVLRLTASPVAPDLAGSAAIALLVEPTPSPRPIDVEAFAAAFGLTPGERRFLEAFVATGSPAEAAAAIGVTRNTVKSHLASIFQKTGCATQPQLMLLLGAYR